MTDRLSPPLIDLRSDTVTRPSPAMRRAMYEAEVGDDVFGDDPTVVALEERAAGLMGKEAGLFVASGTMGNLVCQLTHVARGGEVIAAAESHTIADEVAGHAVIVGASTNPVPWRADGTMELDDIEAAFRDPADLHLPLSALVVLENTHALSMGQPLTAGYTARVAELAHAHGVPLHVDGARIWNAAVALGRPASELVAPADSATFCLSKGLACPVGSVIVGRRDFIARARRSRKLVGGGMRQVGILAAAGLVALEDGPEGMIERLADDHRNARRLAEGLAGMPGVSGLDPARAQTNFVVFRVGTGVIAGQAAKRTALDLRGRFLADLASQGVLMVEYPDGQVRAVTHYGIEAGDITSTLDACRRALATSGAAPAAAAATLA